MLTHWGRDRKRGPGLPLELIVKRQTSETADFFGFADRGRLAPGLKADVNVIDFERLRLHVPEIRYDLPAGGRRLVQRVDGYIATLVVRRAGVRARRVHRRDARQAGARGERAPLRREGQALTAPGTSGGRRRSRRRLP